MERAWLPGRRHTGTQLTGLGGLQADALEHALMAALPLGPQSAAGGVTLPESFHGELQVWPLPGPFAFLVLPSASSSLLCRPAYHPGNVPAVCGCAHVGMTHFVSLCASAAHPFLLAAYLQPGS